MSFLIAGTAAFDLLLLLVGVPSFVIPAWNIPSNEPIRYGVYPLGNMAYLGSMYMIVLLSFERYMAVYQGRKLTIRYRKIEAALLLCKLLSPNLLTDY